MFEGLFNSESAKQFIEPLNDILKVGITEKILFNISDETIKISSTTPNKSNYVILKYKNKMFEGFSLPSVPFNFGVKNLSELVGIMRAFSDGFKIKIENDVMILTSGNSTFTYYGCNEKMCVKGPKKVASDGYHSVFKWNDEFKSFSQAINQLKDQEHIVLSGNKGDTVVNVIVTNNQFKRYNNFSCKVQCTEIKETFRSIVDKNIFHPVVTSSIDEFLVKIFDKSIVLFGSDELFTIVHLVSTKVK